MATDLVCVKGGICVRCGLGVEDCFVADSGICPEPLLEFGDSGASGASIKSTRLRGSGVAKVVAFVRGISQCEASEDGYGEEGRQLHLYRKV